MFTSNGNNLLQGILGRKIDRALRLSPSSPERDPHGYKIGLRWKDIRESLRNPSMDYKEACLKSHEFWTEYEEVNRDWLPDDPVYSIINAGTALSTTADNLSTQPGAAAQNRILEIIIGGEATASAVNRVSVQRAGTVYTANTAITPEKFNSRSPVAAGIYGKASTQALVGGPILSLAFNAFGGFVDWKAAPGEEIYGVNSEIISMRSASGTSIVSSTNIFEEL